MNGLRDLFYAKRWFLISLTTAILIPALVLLVLTRFAKELSETEALEVAAIAVKNYVDENPPRQGWRATDIQILPKRGVVVAVHVPIFEHAKVISRRNDRIKYSYMKLACPPRDAWVYDWLGEKNQIWINLHHHGETLIQAPCPASMRKGYLSSAANSRSSTV